MSISPGFTPTAPDRRPGIFAGRLWSAAIVLAALLPVAWTGATAARLINDTPMWDEFGTVLDFLIRYEDSHSWRQVAGSIWEASMEHRMVNSRIITLLAYEIGGGIDFASLAWIGDAFAVAAIAVLAWGTGRRSVALAAGAIGSLLLFQLQHHENLFSSYASIDHLQVILHSVAAVVALARGGKWRLPLGLLFATLAQLTTAQGASALATGTLMLVAQRNWRDAAIWTAIGGVVGLLVMGEIVLRPSDMAASAGMSGWQNLPRFWLTIVGGVLSLGSSSAAVLFGAVAVILFAWFACRGAFAREPVLAGVALNALIASLLIAYGRAHSEIPPLGSRYMVQSALAWTAISGLLLQMAVTETWRIRAMTTAVALAAVLNVAANRHYRFEAEEFVQRRIDASRFYDLHGTLAGAEKPIYPAPEVADAILRRAGDLGIFQMQPQASRRMGRVKPMRDAPMTYFLDRLAVGDRNVHVRGWLLPPAGTPANAPIAVALYVGDRLVIYDTFPEQRPDVAAAFDRPGDERCGFYAVIPEADLPPGSLRVMLISLQGSPSLSIMTDHLFSVDRRVTLASAN